MRDGGTQSEREQEMHERFTVTVYLRLPANDAFGDNIWKQVYTREFKSQESAHRWYLRMCDKYYSKKGQHKIAFEHHWGEAFKKRRRTIDEATVGKREKTDRKATPNAMYRLG